MTELARAAGSTVFRIQDCPHPEVQRQLVATLSREGRKVTLEPGLADAVLPLHGRMMDQIWKGFNHGTRQRINKARRGPVQIRRLVQPHELTQAYEAWRATAVRKSFSEVRPWSSLEPVVRHCVARGLGSVLASFLDQRLLAAIFITHIGKTASYVYGGYVDGAEKHSPTQVLHDEAIRECLAKGLADYSFGTLLAPKQPEARGVDEFKLGFGALARPQQDTIVWVRKPVIYASIERLRRGWLGRNLEGRMRRLLIRRGDR
jgi:lipid II:glycine glycyltransferase (peptidoglycan interpeptide bridge formation enzyme)